MVLPSNGPEAAPRDPVAFWQELARQEALLARLLDSTEVGNARAAFDLVDAALRRTGFDLPFEIHHDALGGLVALSAEGDANNAAQIERLFEVAPSLARVRVLKRRPRKALADACVLAGGAYGVDVAGAVGWVERVGPRLGVSLYMPEFDHWGADVADGFAQTFLEHAVGEATVERHFAWCRSSVVFAPGVETMRIEQLVARLDLLIAGSGPAC